LKHTKHQLFVTTGAEIHQMESNNCADVSKVFTKSNASFKHFLLYSVHCGSFWQHSERPA